MHSCSFDFHFAKVPIKSWAAVDGFKLQDEVLDIVDSGVVEPAALPRDFGYRWSYPR